MNDPRARQIQFNAESSGQWDGFAEHRRSVSDLLRSGSGRLCILGAGNCNDLDLITLLAAYREVHLVDLDAEALARGAERQGVADRSGLIQHGGLDLTGMLDAMAQWSPTGEVARAELEALVDWPPRRVSLTLPGPFDVVASTCLLSQLVGNAHHAIGERHPQLGSVVRAIRMGHLRLLGELIRPGGRLVLITDVATSEKCPELDQASITHGLLLELEDNRGLIRGTNPFQIQNILRTDPILSARMGWVEGYSMWRWRLHERTYLVCAIDHPVR